MILSSCCPFFLVLFYDRPTISQVPTILDVKPSGPPPSIAFPSTSARPERWDIFLLGLPVFTHFSQPCPRLQTYLPSRRLFLRTGLAGNLEVSLRGRASRVRSMWHSTISRSSLARPKFLPLLEQSPCRTLLVRLFLVFLRHPFFYFLFCCATDPFFPFFVLSPDRIGVH